MTDFVEAVCQFICFRKSNTPCLCAFGASPIPSDILAWYGDSDDEEETVEEVSGDIEED